MNYLYLFLKVEAIIKITLIGMPFNILLLSGELCLIGHAVVFHRCRILQRNRFSFHYKYFQERNGLLGFHF